MPKKQIPQSLLERTLEHMHTSIQDACPDVNPIVTYGTLIGHMRHGPGRCVDKDDDVDFWIHPRQWDSLKACMDKLYGDRPSCFKHDTPDFLSIEEPGMAQVDFYRLYHHHDSHDLCDKWNNFRMKEKHVLPIRVSGGYHVPAQPKKILKAHYGTDWRIPKTKAELTYRYQPC